MKYFVSLISLVLVLTACSSDENTAEIPTEPIPAVPKKPNLIYPNNYQQCSEEILEFNWSDVTTDEIQVVNYTLQIAIDRNFEILIVDEILNTYRKEVELELNTTYYWRVKAANSENINTGFTEMNEFFTQGTLVQNFLPNKPVLIAPNTDEISGNATTSLEWEGSDQDNDSLVYDVYFGTDINATTKISSDKSATAISVDTSTPDTYYWKIVVKDDKGGATIGQIWSFTSN